MVNSLGEVVMPQSDWTNWQIHVPESLLADSTYVGFGLRDVNGFILGGIMVYTSTNYTNNYDRALRPVVSIKTSQIQLCTGDSADGADTTISHMHQIIPTK